jgi:hypothetical protein
MFQPGKPIASSNDIGKCIMRARTHAAREDISLEEAFQPTQTATSASDRDAQPPPELPLDLVDSLGSELSLTLMNYLQCHNKYYAVWEVRLQRQEAELRGVRNEIEALRTQIMGLTSGVQDQRAKIHHQVGASLRRNHKKGVHA